MINPAASLRTQAHFQLTVVSAEYIEDITQWREDINFMFEWREQYHTSECRFLLFRHTDDGVFDDFPKISDNFPTFSEDYRRLPRTFEEDPKMFDFSEIIDVYSCFDKGCPTKVLKRTRRCRLVLWVVRVWRCFIKVHGVEKEGRRNDKYTAFCCFLLHAETN